MLMKQLTSGTLAHAYLFLGPEGAGKTATALAFAKALVCGSEAGGCGVCPACRRADAGVHPDIHIIEHGEETSEIKISQIRKLQEELSLTPFEAQKKAAVIDDAERLNPEASNAFLKTLEEPSRGTVLILTASDRKALLEIGRFGAAAKDSSVFFPPWEKNLASHVNVFVRLRRKHSVRCAIRLARNS